MKSSKISSAFVLVNLSLLAACGGSSNIGRSDGGGGSANSGMAGAKTIGTKVGGAPNSDRDPELAAGGMGATDSVGASVGGAVTMPNADSSAAHGVQQCQSDADCANYGCSPCASGGVVCSGFCSGGQCSLKDVRRGPSKSR